MKMLHGCFTLHVTTAFVLVSQWSKQCFFWRPRLFIQHQIFQHINVTHWLTIYLRWSRGLQHCGKPIRNVYCVTSNRPSQLSLAIPPWMDTDLAVALSMHFGTKLNKLSELYGYGDSTNNKRIVMCHKWPPDNTGFSFTPAVDSVAARRSGTQYRSNTARSSVWLWQLWTVLQTILFRLDGWDQRIFEFSFSGMRYILTNFHSCNKR